MSIRFPKIIDDLNKCQQAEWPLHFNKTDYTGTLSNLSLRSISGKEEDILATPNARFMIPKLFFIVTIFKKSSIFLNMKKKQLDCFHYRPIASLRSIPMPRLAIRMVFSESTFLVKPMRR